MISLKELLIQLNVLDTSYSNSLDRVACTVTYLVFVYQTYIFWLSYCYVLFMPQLSLKRTFFGSVDTDVRRRRPVGRSAGTGPWGEVFLPEARHRGSGGAETP